MQDVETNVFMSVMKVVRKYNPIISLEFHMHGTVDPYLYLQDAIRDVIYFESSRGPDSVVIEMADSELSLVIGSTYSVEVTDLQIMLAVLNKNGNVIWINSAGLPMEAIKEARKCMKGA
ncbi:hypothetical protein D3C72_247460 [compost metagenome]